MVEGRKRIVAKFGLWESLECVGKRDVLRRTVCVIAGALKRALGKRKEE